jgi:hypothetical protein
MGAAFSFSEIQSLNYNKRTPEMHGTPHTHIKISIYILYYNKVRARGSIEKTAVNC